MTPPDPPALLLTVWNDINPSNPEWDDPRVTPPLPDRVPLDRSTVFSQYGYSYRPSHSMHTLSVSQPFARVRYVLDSGAEPRVDLLASKLKVVSPQGAFPLQQTHHDTVERVGPRLMDMLRRATTNELDDADAAALVAWYQLQFRCHGVILRVAEAEHAEFSRWISFHGKWPRKLAPADPSPKLPVPVRIEQRPDTASPPSQPFEKAPFVALVIAEATGMPSQVPIAQRQPLRVDGAHLGKARDQALAHATDPPMRARLVETWRRVELLVAAADPGSIVEVLDARAEELANDFSNATTVWQAGLWRRVWMQLATRPYGAIVVGADFFARTELLHALGQLAREYNLVIIAAETAVGSAPLESFRQTEEARFIVPCTDGDGPFVLAAAMARSHARYGLSAFPDLPEDADCRWTLFEDKFGARHPVLAHIFVDALSRHCMQLAYRHRTRETTDPDAFAQAITESLRVTMVGDRDFEAWIDGSDSIYNNDKSRWGTRLQLAISFLTPTGKTSSLARWLRIPQKR